MLWGIEVAGINSDGVSDVPPGPYCCGAVKIQLCALLRVAYTYMSKLLGVLTAVSIVCKTRIGILSKLNGGSSIS